MDRNEHYLKGMPGWGLVHAISDIRSGIGLLLLLAFVVLGTGCVTSWAIEEAAGKKAELFVSVDRTDTSGPQVYWKESPYPSETLLHLSPAIEGCERYTLYANPAGDSLNELDREPTAIRALNLANDSEELALWQHIPSGGCAIVLTFATIPEPYFSGLSGSTRAGVFQRFSFALPGDVPPSKLMLMGLPFAPIYDATLLVVSPILAAAVVSERAGEPFLEPVTVSFDFPDGERQQVSLTYTEARDILADSYTDILSSVMPAWRGVRFWTRAALVKLDLEFREEHIATEKQGTVPQLTYVDGHLYYWIFDLRDGREPTIDLRTHVGDARFVRFRLR